MISYSLEVINNGKTKQYEGRMRDYNTELYLKLHAEIVVFPHARLISHLECDENENKKSHTSGLRDIYLLPGGFVQSRHYSK